jgi:hypothetical protein
MKKFLFTVIAAIACASPTFAQASSDGFTVAFNLGSSPIAEAFSIGGDLTYNTTLTENLTLTANTAIFYDSLSSAFGLDVSLAPRYMQSLLANENSDLSAYTELEALVTILPTPVALRLTQKAGLNLTYGVSEIFSIQTALEARAIVTFDGQPVSFVPIIGSLVQGNLLLAEQLGFSFGTFVITEFTTIFFLPFLNVNYAITSTTDISFRAGYDPGFFQSTNGLYVTFEGRIKL